MVTKIGPGSQMSVLTQKSLCDSFSRLSVMPWQTLVNGFNAEMFEDRSHPLRQWERALCLSDVLKASYSSFTLNTKNSPWCLSRLNNS